jgi:hypothetical protein
MSNRFAKFGPQTPRVVVGAALGIIRELALRRSFFMKG